MALLAPGAALIGAGLVAQATNQLPRLRELVPHPGRHHRVASRHRQPRQRVGKRPAVRCRIRDQATCLDLACDAVETGADRTTRLGIVRPGRATQGLEEQVETRRTISCGEPVPGDHQVRGCLEQLLLLVAEHPQGEFGVEFRVVAALSCELPVLVVLDEMVIRVARERQGVEPQRVHHRHLQKPQVGVRGPKMREVELEGRCGRARSSPRRRDRQGRPALDGRCGHVGGRQRIVHGRAARRQTRGCDRCLWRPQDRLRHSETTR